MPIRVLAVPALPSKLPPFQRGVSRYPKMSIPIPPMSIVRFGCPRASGTDTPQLFLQHHLLDSRHTRRQGPEPVFDDQLRRARMESCNLCPGFVPECDGTLRVQAFVRLLRHLRARGHTLTVCLCDLQHARPFPRILRLRTSADFGTFDASSAA
jgi:hypothetical protein